MINPINEKYKSKVKRAYKHYRDYQALVDAEASESKQEKKYNLYLDILNELPAREVTNFYKQHKAIHGYD